jgi:hypothetical protein
MSADAFPCITVDDCAVDELEWHIFIGDDVGGGEYIKNWPRMQRNK